jgi:hypothetical protein
MKIMRKEPYIYHPYTCYCEFESRNELDKWEKDMMEEYKDEKIEIIHNSKRKWKVFR